ncbi:hypothetical protein sos41_31790 [Alphaproteobacteria bacterium SO-S41]|nr:hypothetical protein sos41_31790 [Alphaproteobacteria bacterium SO-S41]
MFVRLSRTAAAACCLFAVTAPAFAAEQDFTEALDKGVAVWTDPDGSTPSPERARAEAEYVLGKATFTLYHEFGHAMIDDYKIGWIVQEEAIADAFAGIYMPASEANEARDSLAIGGIRAFMDRGTRMAENDDIDYADSHLTDHQRGFSAACLMVALSAERFGALAEEIALPASRRDYCGAERNQVAEAWLKLIGPANYLDEGQTSKNRITVSYDDPNPELKRVADILKASGLMEAIAKEIETTFQLPFPILLRAQNCDQPNEFWFPDDHEIGFCYNYLDYYQSLGLSVRFTD